MNHELDAIAGFADSPTHGHAGWGKITAGGLVARTVVQYGVTEEQSLCDDRASKIEVCITKLDLETHCLVCAKSKTTTVYEACPTGTGSTRLANHTDSIESQIEGIVFCGKV